jgi:hypothetical protein
MQRVWEMGRGVHRVSVVKPEGKKPLRRSRRRREDIKMDIQKWKLGVWMD